jgi:hypothetical protein
LQEIVRQHFNIFNWLRLVDGGGNPRIDGAVVSLAASSERAQTMMVRG